MTNFEWIKKTSVEELANWLAMNVGTCHCFAYKECKKDVGTSCTNPILKWLESECDVE